MEQRMDEELNLVLNDFEEQEKVSIDITKRNVLTLPRDKVDTLLEYLRYVPILITKRTYLKNGKVSLAYTYKTNFTEDEFLTKERLLNLLESIKDSVYSVAYIDSVSPGELIKDLLSLLNSQIFEDYYLVSAQVAYDDLGVSIHGYSTIGEEIWSLTIFDPPINHLTDANTGDIEKEHFWLADFWYKNKGIRLTSQIPKVGIMALISLDPTQEPVKFNISHDEKYVSFYHILQETFNSLKKALVDLPMRSEDLDISPYLTIVEKDVIEDIWLEFFAKMKKIKL